MTLQKSLIAALLALGILASPPLQAQKPHLQVYRTLGNPNILLIAGRALEDRPKAGGKTSKFRRLVRRIKAFESDELPNADIRLKINGRTYHTRSDRDGLFQFILHEHGMGQGLHSASVELWHQRQQLASYGLTIKIFAPGPQMLMVSDFDDTVVQTHVQSKRAALRHALLESPRDWKPVPGAADAYRRAMMAGALGVVYVSGSPQNFYAPIRWFLDYRNFPVHGLFLKNIGQDSLTEQTRYKRRRIRRILSLFPEWSLILIGDAGQQDPEIYAQIRSEYTNRIVGIVIRKLPQHPSSAGRFQNMITLKDYLAAPQILQDMIIDFRQRSAKAKH